MTVQGGDRGKGFTAAPLFILDLLEPLLCISFLSGASYLNHLVQFMPAWVETAMYVSLAAGAWTLAGTNMFGNAAKAFVRSTCRLLEKCGLHEWRVEVLGKLAGPLANVTQAMMVFLAGNLLVNAIPGSMSFTVPRVLQHFFDGSVVEACQIETLFYSVASSVLIGFMVAQGALFLQDAKKAPQAEIPNPQTLGARFLRDKQRLKNPADVEDKKFALTQEAVMVHLMDKAMSVGLVLTVLVAWAQLANLNLGTVLAIGGAGGLALSLASQDIVQNLISGFLIFLHRGFAVGDKINVGGIAGFVDEIRATDTVIHKVDGNPVIVPNSMLVSNPIVNFKRHDFHLIEKTFPLIVDDLEKLPKVVAAMQQVLVEQTAPFQTSYLPGKHRVYEEPLCYFEGFEGNGANVTVRAYIDGQYPLHGFLKRRSDILLALSNTALSFEGVDYGFGAGWVGGGMPAPEGDESS